MIELTASFHVGEEGGEKELEEWPRKGACNLPRLVEAGVCWGRKAGNQACCCGRKGRRNRQRMTTRVRVGWAGPPPETPPRSPELLTQEGVIEAAVPPGKHEGEAHRSQSCVQVAATAGLSLGFGLRWCQNNPAMSLQTRPALA